MKGGSCPPWGFPVPRKRLTAFPAASYSVYPVILPVCGSRLNPVCGPAPSMGCTLFVRGLGVFPPSGCEPASRFSRFWIALTSARRFRPLSRNLVIPLAPPEAAISTARHKPSNLSSFKGSIRLAILPDRPGNAGKQQKAGREDFPSHIAHGCTNHHFPKGILVRGETPVVLRSQVAASIPDKTSPDR